MMKETPEFKSSLAEQLHRLSITSTRSSSFSLITPTTTVHSLNSDGSTEDGVPYTPDSPPTPILSPFWTQFPFFTPSPTAPFKHEFARLAQHLDWGTKTQRKRMRDALSAEIIFFYGGDTCMSNLEKWQGLCRDVGVEKVPGSIKACKKALRKVHVNIHDLLDYRRNPEMELVRFESYKAFRKDMIKSGNRFPKDCAKIGGVVRGLLKQM